MTMARTVRIGLFALLIAMGSLGGDAIAQRGRGGHARSSQDSLLILRRSSRGASTAWRLGRGGGNLGLARHAMGGCSGGGASTVPSGRSSEIQ